LNREQRLLAVLKALASTGRKSMRLGVLMKRARYKKIEDLRRDIEELEKQELVAYAKSGFPSDSHLHQKVVILRADVISIPISDEEIEELVTEEKEVNPPIFVSPSSVAEKLEIPNSVTLLATRFTELICEKHFEKASELLSKILKVLPKAEWAKGYYYALNGIHIGSQSNDIRLFINNVADADIPKCIKEFRKEVNDTLHGLYDRGFFSAMILYLRVRYLKHLEVSR